ncbi:ribokinase [Labrys miyagiensis]|uniref:Ribokinase n=1 Tax=Labrys miyagiensis TaxID=346912 RepID=A0ABQ6CP29_9HYPH|nr:ribokinase [Labrys miyagiensis]
MICVGTTTLDQVLEIEEMPKQAIKIPALRHAKRGGGPAATAAVACAVLDQPAELWSRMGADSESEFLRERLLHHGVGLSGTLFRSGADTVTAVVIVDRKGERFIVGYGHGSLPCSPEHLPLDQVAKAGAVLADISWYEGAVALLDAARAAKVPSVLDAEGIEHDKLFDLARRSSLPVFSEDGFALISRRAAPDAASCQALAESLGTTIGVTLGAEGSIWWTDGGLAHVPALPVTVQDTTGAGDVFHGALAAALAERQPLLQAARFASAAASLKCELGNGWDGMPDRRAVEQAMERLG